MPPHGGREDHAQESDVSRIIRETGTPICRDLAKKYNKVMETSGAFEGAFAFGKAGQGFGT